ncbi:MAG TPA: hypothetical protein VHU17_20500 [Acidimicrobiales bacterium]|nr:hypothetical protein [Acidimicrobiales bacterium]
MARGLNGKRGGNGALQMRRSSWVKLFGLGMIGGVAAPFAVLSILLHKSARQRVVRLLLVLRESVANQRDEWFSEFTREEFLTGAITRRPRR